MATFTWEKEGCLFALRIDTLCLTSLPLPGNFHQHVFFLDLINIRRRALRNQKCQARLASSANLVPSLLP